MEEDFRVNLSEESRLIEYRRYYSALANRRYNGIMEQIEVNPNPSVFNVLRTMMNGLTTENNLGGVYEWSELPKRPNPPARYIYAGTGGLDHSQWEKLFINPEELNRNTNLIQKNMSDTTTASAELNNIEENLKKIPIPQEPKKISLKGIAEDVANGLTRLKDDPNYNATIGSIQEKYELTASQVKDLFKHSALKGLRVKPVKEPGFEIIEDLEAKPKTESASHAFGKPSAATLRELGDKIASSEQVVKTEEVQLPF